MHDGCLVITDGDTVLHSPIMMIVEGVLKAGVVGELLLIVTLVVESSSRMCDSQGVLLKI